MRTSRYLFSATVFISLASIFTACQPEPLPIKLPQEEGKIVVASQIVPNNTMILALSRTFSALTTTDTGVGNDLLERILIARGFVTVRYNGQIDTLVKVAPGFYGSFTTPLLNNVVYELYVYDSTTGRSATAETRLQPRVQLDTMYITTKTLGNDTNRTLYLRFEDPQGENYYMINVYKNRDFVLNTISNPAQIFSANPDVQGTYPLSDKLFASGPHTEAIDISDWFGKGDTLTATLSSISADYYTYLVQQQRAARNGLGAFFGEPVNYSSNVRNGYGFFTAHWPSSKQWILKD